MKSREPILLILFSLLLLSNCTKLHETVGGGLTPSQISQDSAAGAVLLQGVYASIEFTFTSQLEIFPLSDISTDEAIVPTRANNWDDNGSWRVLHQHKWDGANSHIHDCFKSLGGVVYEATDMLQYNATVQQKAEARFLRAWAMYWLLDLFDQVPYRDPGESVVSPARVYKGMDAFNYIVGEVKAIMPSLPDIPVSRANKSAAKVLLMKCYLNKAVYKSRAAPSFETADMDSVISYADSIILGNPQFSFSANYFDNFAPNNSSSGNENIFTQASNADGNDALFLSWLCPLGYYPPGSYGGYNGFTTLSDFYNKFDASDKRRQAIYNSYPNAPPNPGNNVNVGFLIGEQYDIYTGDSLFVNYTPDVQNIELGPDLNDPGIRPIKYAPDYLNFYGPAPPSNNFVYLRFPDVLLMKAEAILRGGTATNAGSFGSTPESIVNAIRTNPSRGVSKMSIVTLDSVYDERGRELWWENWRRQDMVRFGRFLGYIQEKNYPNEPNYNLIYPIPYEQLSVNPYLTQNPGYH